MPWNFPFWQVFRFAAPALMAGNVGLLKHASNVPQCALAIESIFLEAGFPEGAFQTLLIGSGAVDALLNDPRIVAATLTGSEQAGRSGRHGRPPSASRKWCWNWAAAILSSSCRAPTWKPPSAPQCKARVQNNGQSCIAAKRFIVHEQIADEFEKKFVAKMQSLQVGDPL